LFDLADLFYSSRMSATAKFRVKPGADDLWYLISGCHARADRKHVRIVVLTRQPRDVLAEEFKRVFESGEIERIEQETPTERGDIRHWVISKIPMWADMTGQVSHVITVGEEITDRVEANRAVARAEKLAAVGRLAAGVVHEINNPLATISACAESLEARVNEGAFDGSAVLEDLRDYLGLIRSEAFRGAGVPTQDVDVRVEDGVAILRGSVSGREAADGLVSRTAKVPGVRDVAAMLRVTTADPSS
jgi:signal transduction histidine kinase